MLSLIAVVLALMSLGAAFAAGLAVVMFIQRNILRDAVTAGRMMVDGRMYLILVPLLPAPTPARPALTIIDGGAA